MVVVSLVDSWVVDSLVVGGLAGGAGGLAGGAGGVVSLVVVGGGLAGGCSSTSWL